MICQYDKLGARAYRESVRIRALAKRSVLICVLKIFSPVAAAYLPTATRITEKE